MKGRGSWRWRAAMLGTGGLVCGSLWAAAQDPGPPNLLRNPGFEEDLGPAWHKRTPDDAQRVLQRSEGGRTGRWCLSLENREPVPVRVRQGQDRSLRIEPGSLVEFTAWIKPELPGGGAAGLQFYCMGEGESILAQPLARVNPEPGGWRTTRLVTRIPPGTVSCMAYLQIQEGAGRVLFDDVSLRVVRPPRLAPPETPIGLLTDPGADDECLRNIRRLLGEGCVELAGQDLAAQLARCSGAVVIRRSGEVPAPAWEALAGFARNGGRVFADLRAWAAWQGVPVALERVAPSGATGGDTGPGGGVAARPPWSVRMQTGLRVVRASPVTPGFAPGQVIPYAGGDGRLLALGKGQPRSPFEILAATPAGSPALVRCSMGRGTVVAADLLSPGEPDHANVTGYAKYLFLANVLAEPGAPSLAEYYPRKLSSAEFVALMRQTAADFPAIRFQDEGPACGDYRVHSLNLGRPGTPLYFLYAAAHGSEWEPAYGLLTLAKRLAQGRLADAIDLDKASVKIVPLLNPSGYDLVRRHNARGVDLNRQGDCGWEHYRGRDSNQDGRYGPGDFDWKGDRPFGEPEAETYRRIVQAPNLHCVLDFHGNTGGSGNNKVAILPATARDDNPVRAADLQEMVNQRLRGRHLLRQAQEKEFTPYLLESINADGGRPLLMNTAARSRYGLLVEITAGYAETYGTVLQTDVTCEVCRALFLAYPVR